MGKSTMFLDAKKFKHVKSDDKTTTLQHVDGHQLTIYHNAVSPKMRQQLQALSNVDKEDATDVQKQEEDAPYGKVTKKFADGGEASEYDEYGYPKKRVVPQPNPTPKPKNEFKDNGSGVEDPKGYNRPQYAHGGLSLRTELPKKGDEPSDEVPGRDMVEENPDIVAQPQDQPQAPIVDTKLAPPPEAPGLSTPSTEKKNGLSDMGLNSEDRYPIEHALDEPPDSAPQATPNGAGPSVAEQAPPVPSSEVGVQGVQPQGLPSYGNLLGEGFKNANAAVTAQERGDLGYAAEAQGIQKDAIDKSLEIQKTYDNHYNDLLNELHSHMQDVQEGHIDPEKYWEGDPKTGMGSHSRILSGIGMILAGFNPTSNPNAAIDFVKHNIDKNVEAQVKNLDSKQNLVRANLEQFRNLRDATDMARLQQADVVGHYLDKAAATAKTDYARAAAYNAKNNIAQQYAPLARDVAMRQTMQSLMRSGDPNAQGQAIAQIKMLNPELGKQMSEAYVPGIGMSSSMQPIPQNVREQLVAGQQLQTSANDLLNYSKTHTNLVPGTAEYNFGVAKSLALQQKIREGLLGTVFRESEKPLLQKFVNDNPAGAFKRFTTDPKLRSIIDSNNMNMNVLKASVGLPVAQEAHEPEVKTMGGIKYQKTRGGWQRVK